MQKGLRFEAEGGQRLKKHNQTIKYDGEITKLARNGVYSLASGSEREKVSLQVQ